MRRPIPYHITFTGPAQALATLLAYLPSRMGAAPVRACSQVQVLRQTSVDAKYVFSALSCPWDAKPSSPLSPHPKSHRVPADPLTLTGDVASASAGTHTCLSGRQPRCGKFVVSGTGRFKERYVVHMVTPHFIPHFPFSGVFFLVLFFYYLIPLLRRSG